MAAAVEKLRAAWSEPLPSTNIAERALATPSAVTWQHHARCCFAGTPPRRRPPADDPLEAGVAHRILEAGQVSAGNMAGLVREHAD